MKKKLTAPAFASTTSVPAFCILCVRDSSSSSVNDVFGTTCDNKGSMVTPECPPITGTFVLVISRPFFSATKVFALTTSSVVTPNIL